MADFSNHRRFTLRCLREDIIPVSIRLKRSIKTPKGHHIIRKAERALLNESEIGKQHHHHAEDPNRYMYRTSREDIGLREYGRMYQIHQGEERIKAFQDPREAEV